MKFIAHRGNLQGPRPQDENKPTYLQAALDAGFDVEIDVTYKDGKFYLGHDRPMHVVDRGFFANKRVWSHAKTLDTLFELAKYQDANAFYHTEEDVVVTTRGWIWNHAKTPVASERSVLVKLEHDPCLLETSAHAHGICSDYPELYRRQFAAAAKKPAGNRHPFKLLVLDIDGVMTTGCKTYGLKGEVVSKTYCDLDFTAIKRFKAAGIDVCFLSGDETVNKAMAGIRKVDFYFARATSGNIDKADFIPMLCEKYKVTRDEIAYVGDDYYDLTLIENLKHTFCPDTAIADVKERVTTVLDASGGHGVVSALYDLYKDQIDYAFPVDSYAVNNP
jgi:YrbI family 3-deoxy-D-manno-octulosonate 8-phosphate phosphatase